MQVQVMFMILKDTCDYPKVFGAMSQSDRQEFLNIIVKQQDASVKEINERKLAQ